MGNFIDYIETHFTCEHVSGGRQLRLAGGQCPFCGEERADLRLYIGVESQLGFCHHCGEGFNGPKFVAAYEGIPIAVAIKVLMGDEESYVRSESERLVMAGDIVFPEMQDIDKSEEAAAYLKRRGISKDMVLHFGLKHCPSHTTINDKTYFTRDRVIIPIYDIAGSMTSWQGRDITGRAKTRYLFPPSFKGAEYLYNSHTIPLNAPYLILCEGAFDVYGWFRAGAKNAVATYGKKISEPQLDMLRYLNPDMLYIAWDSDATDKKYEFCEKYSYAFKAIRIVDLDGKDADECSKKYLADALIGAREYDWTTKILNTLK